MGRAQQALHAKQQKEIEQQREKQQKDNEEAEAAVTRTKIEKYKNDDSFEIILKNVSMPKPTDKLPALKKKLEEIRDTMNMERGSGRLHMLLSGVSAFGESQWEKFPETMKYNLTGIASNPNISQNIHKEFDPLFRESLIEYPWLTYSPLVLRFVETVYKSMVLVHTRNTNPAVMKGAKLSEIPTPVTKPIPTRTK